MNKPWQDKTNEEVLKQWDDGGIVWTIEMGGIGPGYEQCIHLMAFEMFRGMLANPIDFEAVSGSENEQAWQDYQKKISELSAVKAVIERIKPSGAQHFAAIHVAQMFARNGYSKAIDMAAPDRRIQVSKNFPS